MGSSTRHETGSEVVREVVLPGGRTLVVRTTSPADADQLAELYAALPDVDLYHRFFAIYRPDRRFVERWASIGDQGGLGLLVEVRSADGGAPEAVGEAGYVPLPTGNGELAICVAPAWRGWLGAYLLDALLESAGERGVLQLEADVLWENHGMLALLRSRGYERVTQDDPCEIRARLSTGARTGPIRRVTWPNRRTTGARRKPRRSS